MAMQNRFDGRGQSDTSLQQVLNAVETEVKRDLHVSTFGIVKSIDGYKVRLRPFPSVTGEPEVVIEAINCCGELSIGNVCLVVFTDRNSILNIGQLVKGMKMTTLDNDDELHEMKYGAVIAKLYLGGN